MDNNYNYSLADLMSVIGNNGNYNGGSSLWLIIFFVIIFGGGGYGWNNRGGYGYGTGELNGYASAASQQDILFSSKFQALDNKIDRIGNGIADATFALNNSIKDGTYTTTNAVKDTAYATGAAVANEGRNIQMQLAQCCCDNKQATAQVRYDMANFAASINSNIDNKFAALEKSQLEQQIAAQAQQISQLQMQASLCGIPRISTYAWGTYPYTAPPVPSCGCNCGNI